MKFEKSKIGIILFISIGLFGFFIFYRYKLENSTNGTFVDSRDGNIYNWVKIGNQVWMAENLKYLPSVVSPDIKSYTSPCYYIYGYNGTNVNTAKATNNYNTYGVLYNWAAAMKGSASSDSNPSGVQGICPSGWHLPSDSEWTQLENYLADNGYNYDGTIGGESEKLAKSMASLSDWDSSSTEGAVGNKDYPAIQNKSGFAALPSCNRNNNGTFSNYGSSCGWWTSTEYKSSGAWYRYMSYNKSYLNRDAFIVELGFSVRCVKN